MVAADVGLPYTPAESEAMTMLCSPIQPQVYEFVSLRFCEMPCGSWWRSSKRRRRRTRLPRLAKSSAVCPNGEVQRTALGDSEPRRCVLWIYLSCVSPAPLLSRFILSWHMSRTDSV